MIADALFRSRKPHPALNETMFNSGQKIARRKIRCQITWQDDLIYPVSGSCINVITATAACYYCASGDQSAGTSSFLSIAASHGELQQQLTS